MTLTLASVVRALRRLGLAGAALAAPSLAEVPAATPPPMPADLVSGPAAADPVTAPVPAYAPLKPDPAVGQPQPWGIDLLDQVTPVGRQALAMVHGLLNPVMIGISLLVCALLVWTVVRYRERANPVPAKFSHNFRLEVTWTTIPALILLVIAVPSFRLLAAQYSPPKADLVVKVTGYQWYWGYEYPDYGGVSFDAVMVDRAEAARRGAPYLLETDNRLVVPAGKTVKLLVTAADVIHSWAVPAFWVKMDAVPGRVNETWFKVDRPGVYYGQCSELCGTKHGFMPIAVEVVPEQQFLAWMRAKQAEQGIPPSGPGIAAAGLAAGTTPGA
ncbi:MAG: cytochrome c oxidase subunit II [Sphingomonadaceae bacterium]|uniref:cytochrome c oxidase subunit II n=1 Tax=Thermaurantiacus sp. TaxID=2820283 RepID=UPI00298EF87D|nr:cytochrome c oxidase subunit II [Thermaurantiacus sp.]MCS6987843.1 cytochrome c oxidase subunit II [Sphingomonadaceae bacterium]MDW8414937.1 cytochrome c oxidase subunit II [Thermaurantiacus sp.]